MLQELGPGRADGQTGSLNGTPRQTESLVTTLGRLGGSRYKLVRTTAYVKPGTEHGTQGTRILYDTTRYQLLSRCPETTDGSSLEPRLRVRPPGSRWGYRGRSALRRIREVH